MLSIIAGARNLYYLKLNDSKTEFMVLGSAQQIKKVCVERIRVGDTMIKPTTSVRNLGAYFDSAMTMDSHVTAVAKAASISIRNIDRIRKHLTREAAETLTHAFVTSRIDTCNSLLYGVNNSQLDRLQRLQNIAARMITYTKKREHITPVLAQLHWLPIEQRILYKICLFVYKTIKYDSPKYLTDLIQPYTPARDGLRSSSEQGLLQEKRFKNGWGDRSFQVAAPKIWNSLPEATRLSDSLDSFKTNLKTHLYAKAFE